MKLPENTPRTPSEFASLLWSDYSSGNVAIAFRSGKPDEPFQHRWSSSRSYSNLVMDATNIAENRDVYFSVAAFNAHKRTCDDVKGLRWLWADLDGNAVGADVPTPTLVMETSSGRRQSLWYLKESPSSDAVEERVRAIAAACNLGNDAVSANQILRVPGTINHKEGRNHYPVYVEEYSPKKMYRLDDFAHLTPGPTPNDAAGSVVLISTQEAHSLWHHAYHKLSPRMRRLAYGHETLKPDRKAYHSQSEADMALVTALVRCGYSGAEAGALFLVSPRSNRSFEKHGKTKTIQRARKYAASAEQLVAIPAAPVEIPPAIFAASLDPNAVAVYATYSEHSFGNKRPFLAQEKIADMLSLNPKTVHSAVERLVEKGFLIPDGTVQRALRYRLIEGETMKIPLPVLHLMRERLGVDGLALGIAIFAGYTDQAALAKALDTTRQRISRKIPLLVEQEIITVSVGPRGLQKYALMSDVTNMGAMYREGGMGGRNREDEKRE